MEVGNAVTAFLMEFTLGCVASLQRPKRVVKSENKRSSCKYRKNYREGKEKEKEAQDQV